MIVDIIAGTRPNFVKIASLFQAKEHHPIKQKINLRLVHTGQHFDHNMSASFFEDLGLPNPDINFGVSGGTHAEQTAQIMIAYETLLISKPSNLCIVVGDVNSTLACALVAKKMKIKVAHIEAGIRSNDMDMPEEINRMVTDSITDYFFTTTTWASNNLLHQGISNESVFMVGNTMIDTLINNQSKFKKPAFLQSLSITEKQYILLTLHRPSNVDDKENLIHVLETIANNTISPIIFPIHPRTKKILGDFSIFNNRLFLVEPLGYLEFLYLIKNAKAVVTDSGGITEEATFLNIPCMTLRTTTERPETVEIGTNELIGKNPMDLIPYFKKVDSGSWKKGKIPDFWDGNTAKRIWDVLNELL